MAILNSHDVWSLMAASEAAQEVAASNSGSPVTVVTSCWLCYSAVSSADAEHPSLPSLTTQGRQNWTKSTLGSASFCLRAKNGVMIEITKLNVYGSKAQPIDFQGSMLTGEQYLGSGGSK